jgi:glycosyltransferase involved in cell wall biosynthesis
VIGFDGSRLSVGERTGTETYTYQLLKAMAPLLRPGELRVYLNAIRSLDDLPGGIESVPIPFPRFWTHARLSFEMLRRPPEVLFVPAHTIPFVHPASVVTIHDLGYLHQPESHPARSRSMLDLATRWSARVARRVIAISDATKRDLISHYGVRPEKIRVIPHGVDTAMCPARAEAQTEVLGRLGITPPYLFTIGTIQPRKNFGRLAAAFGLLAKNGWPHRLVIAGKRGWLSDFVENELRASGMADRIIYLGYADAKDLPALYSGADAFVFPSLYEGFGLPVLEAMSCGTPVVTSDSSALPEVSGEAALLVPPTDPRAIARAIESILESDTRRKELVHRGFKRVEQFSWSSTAQQTLDLLRGLRDGERDSSEA